MCLRYDASKVGEMLRYIQVAVGYERPRPSHFRQVEGFCGGCHMTRLEHLLTLSQVCLPDPLEAAVFEADSAE